MDDARLTALLMADAPTLVLLSGAGAHRTAELSPRPVDQYRSGNRRGPVAGAGGPQLAAVAPEIAPLGGSAGNNLVIAVLLSGVIAAPQLLAQQD